VEPLKVLLDMGRTTPELKTAKKGSNYLSWGKNNEKTYSSSLLSMAVEEQPLLSQLLLPLLIRL